MLRVRSCAAHSHAAEVLKDGDLVLAVNGQPVTSYSHVETIVAACSLAAQTPSPAPRQPPHAPGTAPAVSSKMMEVSHDLTHSGRETVPTKEEQLNRPPELQQQDDDLSMLIKAARFPSSESECSALQAEAQHDAVAMPSVSVTICRGSAVQDVEVQLGREDGLGTCRLIHWCGAMFQVSV